MSSSSCSSVESCLGTFYDILGQVISILDVTTDVIVCIGFYQKDRMVFFGISLSIIILACIAYDIAFVWRFSRGNEAGAFCLFLTLLPFSPLLPFVFYFTDSKDTCLAKFIENHFFNFNISFDTKYTSNEASALRQFMEKKISKHFGFIIEALVEAFPQAILQLIAIVIYKEANVVAIISILLSMLSVASKSFVMSIATALNFKQLFFNWLSAVTDFFGAFFVVCWVFYQPHNEELHDAFQLIQKIWFYKLFICQFIMIGFGCFSFLIAAMIDISGHEVKNASTPCRKFWTFIGAFFLVTFMSGCGVIASVLALEIINWSYLAGTFWVLGTSRFPTKKISSQFLFTVTAWINAATKHRVGSRYKGVTSYTKKQDKMMRLCSANAAILKHGHEISLFYDDSLQKYLQESRENNQYLEVTMSKIRQNASNSESAYFTHKFWYTFYGHPFHDLFGEVQSYYATWKNNHYPCGCDYTVQKLCKYGCATIVISVFTFIFGPVYFVGRFVTLFFPAFIVLYLYFGYNVNIWATDEIDLFQVIMISVYIGACAVLSVLFYVNAKEQYLLAHLAPSQFNLNVVGGVENRAKKLITNMTNEYYNIVVIPIRKAVVIERFGPDLGTIILSYLPLVDEYENAPTQVIKTKNVV